MSDSVDSGNLKAAQILALPETSWAGRERPMPMPMASHEAQLVFFSPATLRRIEEMLGLGRKFFGAKRRKRKIKAFRRKIDAQRLTIEQKQRIFRWDDFFRPLAERIFLDQKKNYTEFF